MDYISASVKDICEFCVYMWFLGFSRWTLSTKFFSN